MVLQDLETRWEQLRQTIHDVEGYEEHWPSHGNVGLAICAAWVLRSIEIQQLRDALEESVRLQSHYAGLLNIYDGGTRMRFTDADAWMERLKVVSKGVAGDEEGGKK